LSDTQLFSTSYSSSRVILAPGENATVSFSVFSTVDTPLLIEIPFKIYFSNPSGENNEITFKGKFLKASDFRPIILSSSFPSSLDPRVSQELGVSVYNPSSSFIDSTVKFEVLSGGNLVFNGSKSVRIEPLSSENVSVPVNFNYWQAPGTYTIRYRAYNKDYAFEWNQTVFNIKGFDEYAISKPIVSQGLFGKTIILNVTNTGTIRGDFSFNLTASPLERLFGYYHEGDIKISGSSLVLGASINSGEVAVFVYKVTYVPVIMLPIVLLLAYYAYYYLNRKITISRKIVPISITENSTTFRVTIKLRSLANSKIKDLRIKEYILPFVKKIGSYGTLHPKQISDLTGKKLLWEVNELAPKGEVIITYEFHTSMGILGRIILPGTRAEYSVKGRKISSKGGVSAFSTGKNNNSKK